MDSKIKKLYFNKNKEYKGDHPIEQHQHYENLLESYGIIECVIFDVKIENDMLMIKYYHQ